MYSTYGTDLRSVNASDLALLTGGDPNDGLSYDIKYALGPLRFLTHLQTLHLPFKLLLGDETFQPPPPPIYELLPPSLRSLSLEGTFPARALPNFVHMLERKEEYLPELQSLRVERTYNFYDGWTDFTALAALCKMAGVRFRAVSGGAGREVCSDVEQILGDEEELSASEGGEYVFEGGLYQEEDDDEDETGDVSLDDV